MIKPGALGGEDASFPLGGMLQAPHGLQGLCGGGTDWLLAGSLGRRVELSTQFQEDRLSCLSLAFIAVGGVDQSRCHLNLPCLVHCSSPGPLAGESRLPSILSLFYCFLCHTNWHLWVVGFFCSKSGIYARKSRQLPAICPVPHADLLFALPFSLLTLVFYKRIQAFSCS